MPPSPCKTAFFALTFLFPAQIILAQANTSLSNLVSPAVNVDLLPGADNTESLGSPTTGWKQVYANGAYYLGGVKFISYGPVLSGQNTAAGNGAFAANTSGYNNTAIGSGGLHGNTTGYNNVAVGFNSLFKSAAGHNNVAVGAASLYSNTSGVSNAAFGNNALTFNTTGSNNMAIGANALYNNTVGTGNIGIGIRTLFSNHNGNYLVAIGDSALYSTTGGYGFNTAVGSKSLYANTTGTGNSAFGSLALQQSTTANYNTACGYAALYQNSTGGYNTATGYLSLATNSSGQDNNAIGALTMLKNTVGYSNAAMGTSALYSNTTGAQNIALGIEAMYYSNSNFSTAVGAYTQFNNTTGSYNSTFGNKCMYNNYTGNFNVAMGWAALNDNETGSDNTAVGTGADMNGLGLTNATALGNDAEALSSNQVMLGNTSVTSVRAAGSFVVYSDGRFKKEVAEDVPGMEFIKALRPVTYHYDVHGIDRFIAPANKRQPPAGPRDPADPALAGRETRHEAAMTAKEKKLYSGFIAQEVEAAATKLHYEFSGLYTPQTGNDLYGLSYSDFVVPLVKAVQQLGDSLVTERAANDSLRASVDSLRNRMDRLEAMMKTGNASTATLSDASVGQNTPNPVRGTATIAYQLPRSYGRAKIQVTDMNGRVLQTIPVSGTGAGFVTVNASALSPGSYPYALYVDGSIVGTKQMLVVR